jgi:predicted dehydrogenase
MNDTPLRLGLVGIGKIARDQHLPAIAAHPGLELAAAASRNARVEGVPDYRTLAEMIAGEALEAVSLCTPPLGRFEQAREAIAAGLHVMLEKPPGATVAEVEDLGARAARAGVTLFATWHSREAASVDAARDWLTGRRIASVHIEWREDIRVWHPGQHWILEPGGFGVFDPGINALSIATRILPEALIVTSAELEVPAGRDTPLAAAIAMVHGADTPVRADFDFLQTGPQTWDITVETDDGTLVLREGGKRLWIGGEEIQAADDGEYPRLYRRFAELVRARASDVDLLPLQLVADAFLVARRTATAPFEF